MDMALLPTTLAAILAIIFIICTTTTSSSPSSYPPPSSSPPTTCSSEQDCNHLGRCESDRCVCSPGWTGITCTTLDLQPTPPRAGLRQGNSSNWCGTLSADPTDPGLFHMWSSDMHGCSLQIWGSGSQILHAVARDPLGPYTAAEVAVAAEAHNPQLIRAPDGTLLLMDSYGGPQAGCPNTCDYANCHAGSMCPGKGPGEGNFTFHVATLPQGPWRPHTVRMPYPCYSRNLTPSPRFHPNGTLYIVFHCDQDSTHVMGDLVMVSAPGWQGPYSMVNGGAAVWRATGVQPHPEDPFLFFHTSPVSGLVTFHIIMHNTPRGIHVYSADGLNFTLTQPLVKGYPQPPFVYNETVLQTDGTSFSAKRRERPWLLLDSDNNPSVLVTAMQAAVWPNTFTHAQPIGSSSRT